MVNDHLLENSTYRKNLIMTKKLNHEKNKLFSTVRQLKVVEVAAREICLLLAKELPWITLL